MDSAPGPVVVREVDEARAAHDVGYLVGYLREMVGFTEADRQRIVTSATLVLPNSSALLDSVYDLLLRFSATRKHFVEADGSVNHAFLEKRRKTLFEWFAITSAGMLDERLGRYVLGVARVHRERSEAGLEPIPLHEIEALFGVLEGLIVAHIAEALSDREELTLAIAAWARMLAVQRALFAFVYTSPR